MKFSENEEILWKQKMLGSFIYKKYKYSHLLIVNLTFFSDFDFYVTWGEDYQVR